MGEVRAAEPCAGEVSAAEVRAGEVRAAEADALTVMGRVPAPDDCQGCLDVRSSPRLADRGLSGVGGWPRLMGVFSDEGCEDRHDRRVIPGRVSRDAFEGVDSADPHVQLVGADLLDRFGVSVGHLTLPR